MAKPDETQSAKKLDGYSQQKLGHAFMSLYAALVAECQTQNMTLGTAWDKALRKIYSIVESKKSETQSYNYLMQFYMSHRKEYIKKMMTDKNKDLIIKTDAEQVRSAAVRVAEEIKKFDDAVKSVTDGEVLLVLKPTTKKPKNGFYNWAENQPDEIVVDFDNDPKSLERAYRKYIFQQKQK